MFTRQLFACTLLLASVRPEEQSVMTECTMLERDIYKTWSYNANAICDGGFKSMVHTTAADVGGKSKEIVSVLKEPKKIISAFVQNRGDGDIGQRRMGESAIYVGEDTGPFSDSMTQCSEDFYDSGFYKMSCDTEGKYASIRRNGLSSYDIVYNIEELRLYQTTNLLERPGVTISAPAPVTPQWSATNLITNFDRRTPGNNLRPLIDKAGNRATWESCFKTGAAQLSVEGNLLVINVNLGDVFFQHAVLAVQDVLSGLLPSQMNNKLKFFQNYEIYIGNSPNYADNPKCPGGPFMVLNDPASYVFVSIASTGETGLMWKFGREVWCNMEGQYMSIVADLTDYAGQAYEMSVCHLAVFGARYKRNTPVPSSLQIVIGKPFTFDVEKIFADETTPIGNTLDIMLRQKPGTEHSSVTFIEDSIVTRVRLAPNSTVPPGKYKLLLESYDRAGGVFSALKTDTIEVQVLPAKCGEPLSQNLAFETTQQIVLVKEYQPTIYFPEVFFSGPHTYTGFKCGGTYTQSITIDAPQRGVVLTDLPAGPDLRPSISIDESAQAGSWFKLTFSGRYVHTRTETDITASFTQSYALRTVFATDYLEQPTLTHSLTPQELTFSIPPAVTGASPPTLSLTAGSFAVAYPFKSGAADSLGKTPPVITPIPYSGFSSTEILMGEQSLGTTSLEKPQGVLTIQGTSFTGDLGRGTFKFACEAWILARQGTSVWKTLNFANSVNPLFTAKLEVRCSYQPLSLPTFASDLSLEVLTAHQASKWSLPTVNDGSFPLKRIRFEPDNNVLNKTLSFEQETRMVFYDGSASIADQKETQFKVKITLVDEMGNEKPYEQTINVIRCSISSQTIETLEATLQAQPLRLQTIAHKVGSTIFKFTSQYDAVVEQLAFNDVKQKLCGPLLIELVTKHPFLTLMKESKVLLLTADAETEPNVFEDSYLSFTVDSFGIKIPIRAEFTACTVTRLAFSQQALDSMYEVGSGIKKLALPKIVQKPDCGLVFNRLKMKSIESTLIPMHLVQQAVTLDPAVNALVVATKDLSFIGKQVVVTISVEAEAVESILDLLVSLKFVSMSATKSAQPEQPAETESDAVVTITVSENLKNELGIPNLVIPPVTRKQAEFLRTPLQKIEKESLFMPMPLAARLSNGVDYVQQLVLEQRSYFSRPQAAGKGAPTPDAIIVKLDNSGALHMRFTAQINFPDDILQRVATNSNRRLAANETSSRIDILGVRRTDFNETGALGSLINNWELRTLNARDLIIYINFTDPLTVSQGDEPDLLLVQLALSGYSDGNGRCLPESLVKTVEIPRQMASVAEAQAIEAAAEAAVNAVGSALGSSFIINILLAGSLYQVWSLINTMQVVQQTRLFNIKSPGNVNAFTDFFSQITSIKALDDLVEQSVDDQIRLPQSEPLSLNFQNAGFDSAFFVPNTRVQICLVALQVCLTALLALLRVLECCCACMGCLRKRVQRFLFWNGSMRLMMETFCDVTLFAMLNFYEIQWPADQPSVSRNNWLAISIFTAYILIPTVLVAYIFKKMDRYEKKDKEFELSFGALLEGTSRKRDKRCAVIFVPISFFAKRLVLCFSLVFWQDFFWGQIALQLAFTTYMIIYLQGARPMESAFKRRLETFNEMATMTVLYLLMYFSDFNPDPDLKDSLGIVFIVDVALFAAVHFSLITGDTCKKLYLILKRFYNRHLRKRPKIRKYAASKRNGVKLSTALNELAVPSQAAGDMSAPISNASQVLQSQAARIGGSRPQPAEEEKRPDSPWIKIPLKVMNLKPLNLDDDAAPLGLSNLSEVHDLSVQGLQKQKILSPEPSPTSMTIEQIERRLDELCFKLESKIQNTETKAMCSARPAGPRLSSGQPDL